MHNVFLTDRQRTSNVCATYVLSISTYSAFAWRTGNLLSVFKTYAERTRNVFITSASVLGFNYIHMSYN